jgi:mono/diheme cytochrome c family protein
LLGLGAVVLLSLGLIIGVLIKGSESDSASEGFSASSIGDATHGRELFSQSCSMCHSYEGRGGTDAPPLDSMQGQLGAAQIADMNGTIWNHVPIMKKAFAEEGIPFPTFEPTEMADLIAYLHGGGPPPEVPEEGGSMETEGSMGHGEK